MNEMNEQDLGQVAGGANAFEFDAREWGQQNCGNCAKNGSCDTVKYQALKHARRAAAEGKEYKCPGQRLYPALTQ